MHVKDFSAASIEEILEKLDEYYSPVTALYEAIGTQLTADISALILNDFVELRQGRLIPYLRQLSEKANKGHDCANCTGKCSIEHNVYLLELQESHFGIQKVLQERSATRPLNDLKKILTEVVFIESTYLVPAITKAQTAINVNG